MAEMATLSFRGKSYDLPVVEGTEHEIGIDISELRAKSGMITLDDSYANTGSCKSEITFIDGDKGILRYRGYAIEELAEKSTFPEVAYLLIFGELPTKAELAEFRKLLTEHQFIHEDLKHTLAGFPPNAPPMAILSAMINATSCFQPELIVPAQGEHFVHAAARLMSKVRTIAAAAYKKSKGRPMVYPRFDLVYTANFLHMMFSKPNLPYEPDPDVVRAMDQLLILHADHEQNCSTSTVRMVASSRANLWASAAAGVCALWGPLHGGANQAVIEMLEAVRREPDGVRRALARARDPDDPFRLMGFGHRLYKTYDPRAKILKGVVHRLLDKLQLEDPLLDCARELEEAALRDPWFVERRLYPNVDFYSGILLRAIGIPTNMFTVLFAIGRLPGWIAQWKESLEDPEGRLWRPRQIYVGPAARRYVPLEER